MLNSIHRVVKGVSCRNSKNSVIVLPQKAKIIVDNNGQNRVIG